MSADNIASMDMTGNGRQFFSLWGKTWSHRPPTNIKHLWRAKGFVIAPHHPRVCEVDETDCPVPQGQYGWTGKMSLLLW